VAEGPWASVAALVEPVRRALYEYVRRQDHAVTREEAADAQGISRNLAAFHLDKLVDVGLLRARYQATGDQPRGRGRTPKVYEPASGGMTLTIPERRYQLVAEILADAIAQAPADARADAIVRAAERGRQIGGQCANDVGRATDLPSAIRTLDELGFEPRLELGDRVILKNCPFHAVAQRQPELVCGLNHAFVGGILAGLGTRLSAHLVPRQGACCVEVRSEPPVSAA
jgi:predicted ArsR family transcriptional regulator